MPFASAMISSGIVTPRVTAVLAAPRIELSVRRRQSNGPHDRHEEQAADQVTPLLGQRGGEPCRRWSARQGSRGPPQVAWEIARPWPTTALAGVGMAGFCNRGDGPLDLRAMPHPVDDTAWPAHSDA